jgi:hypothetical protein
MATHQNLDESLCVLGTTILYDKSATDLGCMAFCIAGHEQEVMSLNEAVTFAVGEYLVKSGVWSID